jgi:hypothetical protein
LRRISFFYFLPVGDDDIEDEHDDDEGEAEIKDEEEEEREGGVNKSERVSVRASFVYARTAQRLPLTGQQREIQVLS